MKVLTPAFFSRKDTKTPMIVALISLILNVLFNYFLAFVMGFGHVGIALGSSIAALISVCILEIILYKDGFIKLNSLFNKFNVMILVASLSLIIFLHFFSQSINFIDLEQLDRIFFLMIEVTAAIFIYFSISRIIFGKPLKTILD